MSLFKFTPYLHKAIWGGHKIGPLKGIDVTDTDTIGESWEISSFPTMESVVKEGPDKGLTLSQLIKARKDALVGQRIYRKFGDNFPLIVKFIDAKLDLSVQVHPNDEMQKADPKYKSKNELWYILSATPGARIYAGFSKPITPDILAEVCTDSRILDYVDQHRTSPGKAFFLPAGCPHAIGAGNFILEIQQCSNTTFRIYDYNRLESDGKPRELHIEQATKALNYEVATDIVTTYHEPASNDTALIRRCPYFTVTKANISGRCDIPMPDDSFLIVVGIDGDLQCTADSQTTPLHKGETILVSADTRTLTITGRGAVILSHA